MRSRRERQAFILEKGGSCRLRGHKTRKRGGGILKELYLGLLAQRTVCVCVWRRNPLTMTAGEGKILNWMAFLFYLKGG